MITHHELQHGHDWDGRIVTGWYGSEKMDGCRALWTGYELVTRTGIQIPAPDWFVERLPVGVALDGEIWAGRGGYQTARVATQHGHWTPAIRFVAFDAPETDGPWTWRLAAARRVWDDVVESFTVRDDADLLRRLEAIQADRGEGIVLRDPDSTRYRYGRSGAVLKVKKVPVTISSTDICPSGPMVAV